jgi:Fe-S-cluster containining protein
MKPIFRCTQCGDCCQGYGGTFVTEQDIQALGAYLHISPAEFVETYCVFSGGRPILAQGPNGYCVFWDELCTIHPVKPRMCRAWPYIESVLVDVNNWRIMAGSCPGMQAEASDDRIRVETIKEIKKLNHC